MAWFHMEFKKKSKINKYIDTKFGALLKTNGSNGGSHNPETKLLRFILEWQCTGPVKFLNTAQVMFINGIVISKAVCWHVYAQYGINFSHLRFFSLNIYWVKACVTMSHIRVI